MTSLPDYQCGNSLFFRTNSLTGRIISLLTGVGNLAEKVSISTIVRIGEGR